MSLAPLHLMLPLWSQVRTDDFLTIGAPSLLAPGNLPKVSKDRDVVIGLWTTKEDWKRFEAHPVTAALRKYARLRPIFFEFDATAAKHIEMSHGHRYLFEAAAIAGALAVPIFADSIFADGDLTRLIALATGAPVRMVMAMGLRISHEPFAAHIAGLKLKPGAPLAIPVRDLVGLMLKYRHSQMRCWNARHPGYGGDIMGGPIWDVGETGALSHSIYWEPALVDFSHEWPHDGTPIEDWTIDGHYPWVNVDGPETYVVVTDSDQNFHVTTAREEGTLAYHFDHTKPNGSLIDEMRRARAHRTTDPLRQVLYTTRYRFHSTDIDPKEWASTEREADEAVKASEVPRRSLFSLEYVQPRRVEEVNGVVIWYYEGIYYCVPKELGDVALDRIPDRWRPEITTHVAEIDAYASAMSKDKPQHIAPQSKNGWKDALPPVLVATVGGTNIVRFAGEYLTIPQSLGPLDLQLPTNRARPGIQTFKTEADARRVAR